MAVVLHKRSRRWGGAGYIPKRESERRRIRKMILSIGTAVAMGIAGLWAVYLRPSMLRFAGETMEILGYAFRRLWIGMPSSLPPSAYLPYTTNFLAGHFSTN